MSTEFYIKDKQGTYLSEDNDIRYRKLEGKELYEFLQTDEGKKKNFHIEVDENGDKLGIEVEENDRKNYESYNRRARYIYQNELESNIAIVSGNMLVSENGEAGIELLETVIDLKSNVENEIIENMNHDILQKALQELRTKDYEVIYYLYLAPNPMTERQLATMQSVPLMTIHNRKIVALNRLKKFF